MVQAGSDIDVDRCPSWASRGSHKLLKALEVFQVDPSGKVCIDIGASTGGFTDVLLSRGASRVFSVDVGYGQLAWRLRNDPRVTVMERCNARNLEPRDLPEVPGIAVIDVSFISLKKIMPAVSRILASPGDCICLVKPQFEAGRAAVGKNGVVRGKGIHISVLVSLKLFFSMYSDMTLIGVDFSPILGPRGNMEFLFHSRKCRDPLPTISDRQIEEAVEKAHSELSQG